MSWQRRYASDPCRSDGKRCSCRHCVGFDRQLLGHASCIRWACIRSVAFGTCPGWQQLQRPLVGQRSSMMWNFA